MIDRIKPAQGKKSLRAMNRYIVIVSKLFDSRIEINSYFTAA
jgi:hypothetical protein